MSGTVDTDELFVAAILFVIVGTAVVASLAGLSMALGAFVAGLLLAETEFRKAIETTIEPFKGLLLGLFFFTVGMSIDFRELAREPLWLAASVVGLIGIKAAIVIALARAYRIPRPAAIETALKERRRIYVYGTGATGRLAKEMESTFWRPYWRRVDNVIKGKLEQYIGGGLEVRLVGEMTGADRALISSLEGFEDLQLIGRLQLRDHMIARGDVVIEVTEGGETSAGIGTVLGARDQWKMAAGYDVTYEDPRF